MYFASSNFFLYEKPISFVNLMRKKIVSSSSLLKLTKYLYEFFPIEYIYKTLFYLLFSVSFSQIVQTFF